MKFTQLIPVALSLATTTLAQSFCSSASHSGESVKETSNKVGSIGGIGYELWADSGNNSATFYSDGSFSCTFQSAGDYLCRSGLSFDSTKTPSQIGRMKADFKLVKQNISNVGYSYVGVYGWTRDPLVEYYIVDNWLSPSPPGDWVGNKKHGAFTIDGAQYTVYENTRTGPSIDGDTTFKQYFSIRQQARDCGTIDISAHFDQWEKLGMKMGKLHEAKVLGEAGNGSGGVSGTADFPYAKVYIGDGNAGGAGGAAPAPAPAQEQAPAPAPAQGNDQQQQAPAPAQEPAPAQGNQGDWNNWGNQGGNQGGNPWDQDNQWNQGGNQGGNPWDQGNQWNQGGNQGVHKYN
ncbi:concanavalin A-like lectin/glucanase domain-containing protein [Neocallimastix sp. 'constans']